MTRHWDEIRRQAHTYHAAALAAGGEPAAAALLVAAERLTGVMRVPVPAGDALLDGADALLDAAAGLIIFSRDVEPWRAAFHQTHEYAHLWLDGARAACAGPDLDAEAGDDAAASGARRVEGYGPRERREREANVFALEFLLPCPLLRRWYLDDGLDAAAIAARTGLPLALVCAQLSRALLLPWAPDPATREAAGPAVDHPRHPHSMASSRALDDSQRRAAHAPRGPLLLEAGPGTGKTRTLVARILYLLERGVPASSILALTFSQRAAEEMRGRVAEAAPQAASALWLGTFHAFGLELLRKYGGQLGLPPAPTVLDPLDALAWLERRLPALALDHYQSLYEPARPLRDVLAAIARAKDEMVGPADYAALAERMHGAAATESERERADRALEVARVYAAYQDGLQSAGLLDFGDLIARAVALLREHPDVRAAVRRAYTQVLVDEYQDVNRASALLLRELSGDGEGLWVVGDARQAIYRFRGAAPANMRLFAADFPGAEILALERNYRSQPAIVNAVTQAASRMRATAGAPVVPWTALRRSKGGEVRLEIAEDAEAELHGLARAIEARRAQGLPYAGQAVLCRSHATLTRVAAGLERAGVPVLYLGDVFERPEVRDMLALLALASGDGHALVRVARLAEYAVPLADVLALLALARTRGVAFPRALALAPEAAGVSSLGKAGLALLARHLDSLPFGADAWSTLTRYLFSCSGYLRATMGDDPAAMQRRLALYQLLQVAHDWRTRPAEEGEHPTRAFLRQVRRLESFGEDRGLRQVPEWAEGIDAVRLLTIHASKGLEFDVVYLPTLAQRYFPAPRQPEPCPPPHGMLAGERAEEARDEEEECLFFVAISRARDRLYLSRARRYGRRGSKPSRLLALLAGALPGAPDGPVTWPAPAVSLPPEPEPPVGGQTGRSFDAETLELYLRCPRRYYYEQELGLRGRDPDDGYGALRRCVHEVVSWLEEQSARGSAVAPSRALARLAEIWQELGPRGHTHEDLYRRGAEAMVARAVDHLREPAIDNRQSAHDMRGLASSTGFYAVAPAGGAASDNSVPVSTGGGGESGAAASTGGGGESGAAASTGGGGESGTAEQWEWAVGLERGRVVFRRSQRVDVAVDDGVQLVTIQRLRTGRSGGESQQRSEALCQAVAARAYPAARRRVRTVSLATGTAHDADALDAEAIAARLAPYDDAMAGIQAAEFAPRPDDRRCPRCPHYFICPS